MNGTLWRATVGAFLVIGLLLYSIVALTRRQTLQRWLTFLGSVCSMIVVVTHLCEGLQMFRDMRWGAPDSPGHYLDLSSALIGVACLVSAAALGITRRTPVKFIGFRRRIP